MSEKELVFEYRNGAYTVYVSNKTQKSNSFSPSSCNDQHALRTKTLERVYILTAIGFSARRHAGEQPECMWIHEDCEPSEQRRPKIQVRRVYSGCSPAWRLAENPIDTLSRRNRWVISLTGSLNIYTNTN